MSSGLSARRLRRLHDVMAGHVTARCSSRRTAGDRRRRGHAPRRPLRDARPYFWDGGYGTSWTSDPTEDLIGILMTQRMGFLTLSKPYLDFWTGAYQAIDD